MSPDGASDCDKPPPVPTSNVVATFELIIMPATAARRRRDIRPGRRMRVQEEEACPT